MQHNVGFINLVNECMPFIQEIDVITLKNKIDNHENFALIDVREDNEWQRGHIAEAIHLSRGVIERDIEKNIPQKEMPIILYCGGGYRSALSAFNLQKMGYKHVFSLKGGISDWLNNNYKIII